jgi:predicted transcriptional regulator
MTTINERVQLIFDELDTNAHAFAEAHSLVASSLYNVVKNNRKPNSETLERVCLAEPRISAEFLLRGEGKPLRDLQRIAALTTIQQLQVFKTEINQMIDAKLNELSA